MVKNLRKNHVGFCKSYHVIHISAISSLQETCCVPLQKRKLSAKKNKLSESSKKQKKSPGAEPGGFCFVREPVLAADAKERLLQRYENKVWVTFASLYFSDSVICYVVLFLNFLVLSIGWEE